MIQQLLNARNMYKQLKAKAESMELSDEEKHFMELYEDNQKVSAELRKLRKMIKEREIQNS